MLPDGRDIYATYVLKQVDGGKIVSNCSANVEELEKALAKYESKWHCPCVSFLSAEGECTAMRLTRRK
jgi:hypothetical protein